MLNQRLDVVVPLLNEIAIIPLLHRRLINACQQLPIAFRIIYVDDGSTDGTGQWIVDHSTSQQDVHLIRLSRNFGQPAAILAGLRESDGECVVVMDGDLQDPPELISELYNQWRAGNEVVIARRNRRRERWLRGFGLRNFHRFYKYLSDSAIPAHTGTFCLLDHRAAAAIREMPETHRFFPGLRAWIGFRQSMVDFERPERAGGRPKQTFLRLSRYALDAIFGFSLKPLRMLTVAGCLVSCSALLIAMWTIIQRTFSGAPAPLDLPLLGSAIVGLGGLQLVGMGILGEYLGRIYDEAKQRPQYIIADQFHSKSNQAIVKRVA